MDNITGTVLNNEWPENSPPFSAEIDVGLGWWDYLIVFRSPLVTI